MNPIGVVICNYNKKDFVLQCVQSVLESKEKNFDIYVVDNASSDGSAEALKKAYGNRITVIENKENLGGSGVIPDYESSGIKGILILCA